MSLKVGDTIGDYEILANLGSGGMGRVYKVRNVISNRVEAAKVVLPNLADDPDLGERFVREIRVHASLEHPNIASMRTALREENQLLLIMELVDGVSLAELPQQGKVPVADCVRYIDQALSALAYAHSRGVIHRDIKPANMMLTPDGTIKLMDFGIAKAVTDRSLTGTGIAVGSLYYMSPEQIQGSSDLDARSDLYSLGVSLYELLTGQRPFDGESEYSIMAAHLEKVPVPPLELDATLPDGLNDVILMAIAKDPAQRFQTAQAFQNALRSVTAGLVEWTDATASTAAPVAATAPPAEVVAAVPAPRPRSGHRLMYMVIGSVATVLLLIVAVTQLPKWRTIEASPTQEKVSEPLSPETEADAAEGVTGSEDLSKPVSPPGTMPDLPAAAKPKPAAPQPVGAAPTPAEPAPVKSAPPMVSQKPATAGAAPTTGTATTAESATTAGSATAAGTAATSEADLEREKALNELQESLMLMAARIGAVNSSLDDLVREQARSGLSLRADMVAARQRMEFRMDQAEAAIQSGDPETAKKQLDFAQRELEKLERFLHL